MKTHIHMGRVRRCRVPIPPEKREKLEEAYKMSTVNRTESDRLTQEANDILEEIKKIEEAEA